MRGLVAIWLVIGAACAPGDSTAAAGAPAPSPSSAAWTADPNHVFRASPGTPSETPGCRDNGQVEALLKEFASAFNSGDPAAIQATLSTEFWAVSLSVGGRHEVAYVREDAIRYLLERNQAGDRLEFVRVQVNELVGWDGAAHIGPFAFVLSRSDGTVNLDGKGALYCGGRARGIKVLGLFG